MTVQWEESGLDGPWEIENQAYDQDDVDMFLKKSFWTN